MGMLPRAGATYAEPYCRSPCNPPNARDIQAAYQTRRGLNQAAHETNLRHRRPPEHLASGTPDLDVFAPMPSPQAPPSLTVPPAHLLSRILINVRAMHV